MQWNQREYEIVEMPDWCAAPLFALTELKIVSLTPFVSARLTDTGRIQTGAESRVPDLRDLKHQQGCDRGKGESEYAVESKRTG